MKYTAIIILFFSSCLACLSGERTSVSATVTDSAIGLKFSLDTVHIPVEGKIHLHYGGKLHATAQLNDSTYLITDNCRENLLLFYNMDAPGEYFTIPWPDSGLCLEYYAVHAVSRDQFYLLQASGELWKFRKGKWEQLLNINHHPTLQRDGMWVDRTLTSNDLFVENDSVVLFNLKQSPEHRGKYSGRKAAFPLTARLNLLTQEIRYTGIRQPAEFINHIYGLLDNIYPLFRPDTILYFTNALHTIWITDSNNTTVTVPVKSAHQTDSIVPFNRKRTPDTKDLLFAHLSQNGRYELLVPDPFRSCYYRFFLHPLPKMRADGLFSVYTDQRMTLMVLDSHLKIMGELLLPPKNFFIYYAIPTRNGLLINNGPVLNIDKNGYTFLKISFSAD